MHLLQAEMSIRGIWEKCTAAVFIAYEESGTRSDLRKIARPSAHAIDFVEMMGWHQPW